MTAWEPTILRLAAILIERLVPLVPPVSIGFFGCVGGIDAGIVLASVVEGPECLPIRHRQIQ